MMDDVGPCVDKLGGRTARDQHWRRITRNLLLRFPAPISLPIDRHSPSEWSNKKRLTTPYESSPLRYQCS